MRETWTGWAAEADRLYVEAARLAEAGQPARAAAMAAEGRRLDRAATRARAEAVRLAMRAEEARVAAETAPAPMGRSGIRWL